MQFHSNVPRVAAAAPACQTGHRGGPGEPTVRMVLLRMGVVDPGLSSAVSSDYVARGRPYVYSPSEHVRRRVAVAASTAADELNRQRRARRQLRASGLSR